MALTREQQKAMFAKKHGVSQIKGRKWAVVGGGDELNLHEFKSLKDAKIKMMVDTLTKFIPSGFEDDEKNLYIKISDVSKEEYDGWIKQNIENLKSQIKDNDKTVKDELRFRKVNGEPSGLDIEFFRGSNKILKKRLKLTNPDVVTRMEK